MFLIKLEHFEKCLETFFAGVGFFSEILILQVIFGQIPKKFMKYFEKKKIVPFVHGKIFWGIFRMETFVFQIEIFFCLQTIEK